MASVAELRLPECLESELLRVKYFPRQLLTADDMQTDQDYLREKQRRHNRFLHGWGSVCGLEVLPAPTDEAPWLVQITEGYALSPYGDEIYVAEPVFLDLALCGPGAATDPCDPGLLRRPSSAEGQQVFVAIKYAECLARPVRAMPAGCACDEEACEYSRIRDSFQLECLTELPPSHQPPSGPTLCDIIQGRALPVCPPCPAEPWIVLAQVNLPASPSTEVTADMIDNFTFRRQVFSTAVLQDQLIRCCCGDTADLAVAIQRDANTINDVTSIDYRIVINNNGPSSAQNIIVFNRLNVSGGVMTSATNFRASREDIIWTNTELPEPRPTTAEFIARIPVIVSQELVSLTFSTVVEREGSGPVTIENAVEVTSDTRDSDASNNQAVDTFSIPSATPPVIDGPIVAPT